MKHDTRKVISLRRRHLMIAGLAGVAAPATVFAAQRSATPLAAPAAAELHASGSGREDRLVVSGRMVGAPDGKPIAGARLEAWHADANGEYIGSRRGTQDDSGSPLSASVTTDADGRFMFTTIFPAGYSGRPPQLHYRVGHGGHETPVAQLHFARQRGISCNDAAHLQRDDAGTWRAAFGLVLV